MFECSKQIIIDVYDMYKGEIHLLEIGIFLKIACRPTDFNVAINASQI